MEKVRFALSSPILGLIFIYLFRDLHVLKKSKRDKWKYSNLAWIVIFPTTLCVIVTQADGTLYRFILDPDLLNEVGLSILRNVGLHF